MWAMRSPRSLGSRPTAGCVASTRWPWRRTGRGPAQLERLLGDGAVSADVVPGRPSPRGVPARSIVVPSPSDSAIRSWNVAVTPHLTVDGPARTVPAGGAPGRDRTCDQVLRRHLLYPLSYGRSGSDHRTPAGEGGSACGDGRRHARQSSNRCGRPPPARPQAPTPSTDRAGRPHRVRLRPRVLGAPAPRRSRRTRRAAP
jgi:hypothetical protein